MRKIELDLDTQNKQRSIYIKGTPDYRMLSKQDYEAFISSLEMEIRDYYKNEEQTQDGIKFGQPP